MKTLVLDASVALGYLLREERVHASVAPLLRDNRLIVPAIWRLEVGNVLVIRERKKSLTQEQTDRLLRDIADLGIIEDGAGVSLSSLFPLARRHQLTTYDASYLEIALRLSCPLLTADRNLRLAAEREKVALAWSPD